MIDRPESSITSNSSSIQMMVWTVEALKMECLQRLLGRRRRVKVEIMLVEVRMLSVEVELLLVSRLTWHR